MNKEQWQKEKEAKKAAQGPRMTIADRLRRLFASGISANSAKIARQVKQKTQGQANPRHVTPPLRPFGGLR